MELTVSLSSIAIAQMPMLLAQTRSRASAADAAAAGGAAIVFLIFLLIALVFFGFCTWKILQKCGHPNPWMGWIPIVSNYAVFQAAGDERALLWTILGLIPYVGLVGSVMLILAWIKIFQKLDKSPWLLLLCLTGIGAFFVFGYVALA